MWVNFHFMLIYSPACSTCIFSWYGLLITVGGVGGLALINKTKFLNDADFIIRLLYKHAY